MTCYDQDDELIRTLELATQELNYLLTIVSSSSDLFLGFFCYHLLTLYMLAYVIL